MLNRLTRLINQVSSLASRKLSARNIELLFDNFKTKIIKPQGFFLVFSICFGTILVFLTPPLQTPDEQSHFLRAYQVSNLKFVSEPFEKNGRTHYGSDIPKSVNLSIEAFMGNVPGHPQNQFNRGLFKDYIGQPLEKNASEKTIVEAGGVYSPVVYVPQATGISIGKLFNASPLILIWLGRLANLIVWIVTIYVAIKLFPIGKWGLVVLSLNPVAVFISASMSPDVINISFAFLLVSLITATFLSKENMSKRYMLAILAILSVLSLSKPVNILFALLLFMIPVRHFRTRLQYIGYSLGGVIFSVALFTFWNYQIKDILDASVYAQSGGLHISVRDQLSYILHTPFDYAWDIIRNYIVVSPSTYGDAVLTTFFGVFGWLDTTIPLWTIIVYLFALFLGVLYQFGRGTVLTLNQKALFLGLFILAFIGNITAMYFNATVVGSHVIGGVQGRYFIPFSILLLGLFTSKKKVLVLNDKSMMIIVGSMLTIVLSMTILKIFLRYY